MSVFFIIGTLYGLIFVFDIYLVLPPTDSYTTAQCAHKMCAGHKSGSNDPEFQLILGQTIKVPLYFYIARFCPNPVVYKPPPMPCITSYGQGSKVNQVGLYRLFS